MNPDAMRFAKHFFDAGKPVAAICHGPWTVVEIDAARGRTLTSWPSLKTDIRNVGGTWVDKEVVTDNGLVTNRKPDDIPTFNRGMIALFGETEPRAENANEKSRRPFQPPTGSRPGLVSGRPVSAAVTSADYCPFPSASR